MTDPEEQKQQLVAGKSSSPTVGHEVSAVDNGVSTVRTGSHASDDYFQRSRRARWWHRPTIKEIESEHLSYKWYQKKFDDKHNEATRLPDDEEISIGGIVLTEVFTPSTISNLYSTLRKWPDRHSGRVEEWITRLQESRSSPGGGWQSLGLVRRPGELVIGEGFQDPELPDGIEAVWLTLSYLGPSLAVVCAIFTFEDSAGDLSQLLRADYQTTGRDFKIIIPGRLGRMRTRIKWSRPRHYSTSNGVLGVEGAKLVACQDLAAQLETSCRGWFDGRFRGRFSEEPAQSRPLAEVYFTKASTPFSRSAHGALSAINLDWWPFAFQCDDLPGWHLRDGASGRAGRAGKRLQLLTFAARRADVARSPDGGAEPGLSNWYLTQRLSQDQSSLIVRFAAVALLRLYSVKIGQFRDDAGKRKRLRRPVTEARQLDSYLMRDGLDSMTVAADLQAFASDLRHFRWNVPEYTEIRDDMNARDSVSLVPALRKQLKLRAKGLREEIVNTEANVRASAELRQAIANTRHQRVVLIVSIAAVIISVIALVTTT